MVSRADQRRGGTSPNSVVSVADLLARDAPWAGAPAAVAVAKRPARSTAPFVPAQRTASPTYTMPSASRAGTEVGVKAGGDSRLRQFTAAAWGPQWRFVTIAAAVLFAGLMANGVMLVTFNGPGHSAAAGSDEGGYPDPNDASRTYDDNGFPTDSALSPIFSSPGTGDLSASNASALGLPMTLTSLGTAAPTASPSRSTTVLRSAPVASTPVRAVSPTTTSTGSTGTSTRSSSGSTLGNVVRDTTSGLGDTVSDTTTGLGKTVEKTTDGLGKTLKKTTDGLGKTVGNVADDLLGGGSSKSKSNSSDSHSSNKSSGGSSKSGSNGGLLGGLLGN